MNGSLERIRRNLTFWYIGVFALILLGFGAAIYSVAERRTLEGIDRSLERTVNQRTRWVLERRAPTLTAQDSALYERRVVVFNAEGEPISPAQAEPWLVEFAGRVLRDSIAKHRVQTPDGRVWQLYGKRILTTRGNTYATVAVSDLVELQDRFPSLFRGLAASALVALVLVGAGGAALARKSTDPVERAFQQMRRFMGDAAHELKTPVAVLRARAEIALQRPRDAEEYQEVLSGMLQETERLGGLVENMLILARADAGQWPVRRETVYLDDVLLDAASAARALAAPKGVRIDVGEFEETPVRGDPALLRQLVMVLIDNAIKYTPAGGGVTVESRRRGGQAEITVADTGVGIPAVALPYVFDRFFRADSARSRGGAGLGLPIAQWIVDQHGGRIEIRSTEGEGTRAVVSLPMARRV